MAKDNEILRDIRLAYLHMMDLSDRAGWGATRRIDDAYNYEVKSRRGSSRPSEARMSWVRMTVQGLMVEEFFAGYSGGCRTASDIWDMSPGLATAYLFGGHVASRTTLSELVESDKLAGAIAALNNARGFN